MPPELQPEENPTEALLEGILLNQNEKAEESQALSEAQLLEQSNTTEAIRDLEPALDMIVQNTVPKDVQKIELVQPTDDENELAKTFYAMLRGRPGKTPIKGEDYYTEEDKNELVDEIVPRVTPVLGQDYFTDEEKETFAREILEDATPVKDVDYFDGVDGYTPVKGVDYFDGEPGKDAEVDIDSLVVKVTSVLPAPAPGKPGKPGKNGSPDSPKDIVSKLSSLEGADRLSLSSLKDTEFLRSVASKTVSLSELDDVNLTGLTQTNGKYNLGSGGGSGVQTVTGLNTDNTDPANPIVQISVDGVTITGDGTPGDPLVSVSGGSGTVTSVASADGSITVTNPTTTPDLAVVKAPILTTARTIGTITGDATSAGSSFDGSANNTNALTLATVNGDVGSFTNASITVNAKGLITAASSGAAPEVPLTFSTGLTRATNTITANISTGIAGSQTIYGGTAANEDLTIEGTSNATKTTSYVVLQPTGGNVGIGTTSPQWPLDIYKSDSNSMRLDGLTGNITTIFSRGAVSKAIFGIAASANSIITGSATDDFTIRSGQRILFSADGGTTGHMVIQNSGNVGINTTGAGSKLEVYGGDIGINDVVNSSPAVNFQINGVTRGFVEYSDLGGTLYLGTTLSQALGFDTNYTRRMTIDAVGNVGIGNTSPSALLTLGTAGTTAGTLSLAGGTSGVITLQTAAAAGTYTLTLPTTDGNSGEVLSTDGSGVLSWIAPSGGGTIGGSTGSTDNRILRADGTGGSTLQSSSATLSDAGILTLTNSTDSSSNQVAIFESDRATPTTNDTVYVSFKLSDSAGNQDEFGRIRVQGTDVTSTSEDSRFIFGTFLAGTFADRFNIESDRIRPATGNPMQLGDGSNSWEDLFLASGGVINFNNGDITITHSTNDLTFSGSSGAANGYFFNNDVSPTTDNGAALGKAGTAWADLFLAEGAVINWDSGDVTLTQTGNVLAVAGGDLRVATADVGTNADSVPTLSSTSTLTNKTLTNPTINAAVISGDFQVDATPNTDDTWNGPSTNTFNAGATIAQFDCVYLSSSSTWLLTDADAVGTAGSVMVAMAGASGTNGNALRVILPGTFVRNDAWAWTPGVPLFLDTATPGGMTATAPSGTDDVVRIVGHAVTADVIFFNPSNDWLTRV